MIRVFVAQDLAGVMMVIPLFVTHLRHLGMSPLMNGAIRSFYGVLQLVSSPLMVSIQEAHSHTLLSCIFYVRDVS